MKEVGRWPTSLLMRLADLKTFGSHVSDGPEGRAALGRKADTRRDLHVAEGPIVLQKSKAERRRKSRKS